MSLLSEIGKNVTLLRVKQHLTQEKAAFLAGISVSRLQEIEHGCQNMTLVTLNSIADALGVDSRVLRELQRPDYVILSEIRRAPYLPGRTGGALQIYENILLLRKSLNITQKQLASISGISAARLRDIEHGCANVTVTKLNCIANAFGLSLLELNALAMCEEELMKLIRDARNKAGIADAVKIR